MKTNQLKILEELQVHTKLLQEIYKQQLNPWKGVIQPNCCPPHNFIPFAYAGGWAGSMPPPNMKCTKCLMETNF